MCRRLKRVPLNFFYPYGLVWCGYSNEYLSHCPHHKKRSMCAACWKIAAERKIPLIEEPGTSYGCPIFHTYYQIPSDPDVAIEPPIGDGYQLWEVTSEGSPMSPVFTSFCELCTWCEENSTVYANEKISKTKWMEILTEVIFTVSVDDININ